MNPLVVPGQLEVKLRLGEAPRQVAAVADVRARLAEPAPRIGLRAVDRVLRHYSEQVGIARVHTAASSLERPGRRHLGFDALEQVLGLSRTFAVRLDRQVPVDAVAEDLRNIHEVEVARPVQLEVTPFRTAPSSAGVVDRSRAIVRSAEALQLEPGHPSVTLAILDTGIVDDRHGFRPSVLQGYDTVQLGRGDLAGGLELLGDTSDADVDPVDEVGHGTACASIVAAAGNGGLPPGLAGACTVLPVRVLGSVQQRSDGHRLGVGSPLDIDAGLKRAADLNAKVINCSFGTLIGADVPAAPVPHADVVAYALARGCVLVAASGNTGRTERYTPAALDGVVAVGSVDQDGSPSAFTTTGPHLTLSAPGRTVLSAGLDGPVLVSGTSFAAPFVAATAALLVSLAARRSEPIDGRTVAGLLRATARPWPSAVTGHGTGILDAVAALEALDRGTGIRSHPSDRLSRPAKS